MKTTIKLNESQLRKVIAESVKKVLKEGYDGMYADNSQPSYIGDAYGQIKDALARLQLILEHIDKLTTNMSDDEYQFGRMDTCERTIEILREMYPLITRLGRIWGLEHY